MLGAAQQPKLLDRNLLQTQQLTTSRLLWRPHTYLWFPYGNLLILLGRGPGPLPA
jgi:hypothetical protein